MNIVNCLKEKASHLYTRGQQPVASVSQVPCVGIGGMPGNSDCIHFPALTLSMTKDSGLGPFLWLFLLLANSQKLDSLRSNSVRSSLGWSPNHAWTGPRECLDCILHLDCKDGIYHLHHPLCTCMRWCRACTSLCHTHTHTEYGCTCIKL